LRDRVAYCSCCTLFPPRTSAILHQFAGDAFGGEVHLVYFTVQQDGSVFGEGERGDVAVAALLLVVREAGPSGAEAEEDFVVAELDDGEVVAVESLGGCVGAEQGGPGDPEFGVE
jgi:hypothetical protein